MIIYYAYKPNDDLAGEKLKSYLIQDHLPNEHIIQGIAYGVPTPKIRLLFNSGRVWKSSEDRPAGFEQELSGEFIKQFGVDQGLLVTFIDSYTSCSIYLVKDLKRGGKTLLYGEGTNDYDCLGNSNGVDVRMIFEPKDEEKITHIACCFSFSCCVINRRNIRISGQNWLSSNATITRLDWNTSQFISDEDIVDIKGEIFTLLPI
ncbi:predicted protein [Naegleria gruberi]|uniref:Predicted protein n=1 Tax=Naegleria gruberi TaxID=5762 RepID=D2VV81_NAEGR|nr:uncharacterized protein NAEGRDRAFT_72922 [Naegleria gruberi]EFC39263.1 predicted protein [Naegleria gruberi]|eukprot:XP_002672007.1 predicted protein [Naegleria gruberi strain NEG-M]